MDRPVSADALSAALAANPAAPARRVSTGLNLVMRLKDKGKMPELLGQLEARRPKLRAALDNLHYLHFSRFLPLWEDGLLLVVTEFDGDMRDYVMDFAAVLSEEFSLILSYMDDAPPLPVHRYPREFWNYVERQNDPRLRNPRFPAIDTHCSYPSKTVIDILDKLPGKAPSGPPPLIEAGDAVKESDVQANILRGYKGRCGVHLAVKFKDAAAGRALLKDLTDGKGLNVTHGANWGGRDKRPAYCLNIGFTFEGLEALGVDALELGRFPDAFREGPARRAAQLGDDNQTAGPKDWVVGKPDQAVHALLSLYTDTQQLLELHTKNLEGRIGPHADTVYTREVAVLGSDAAEIHFGYREGFSQPQVDLGAARPGPVGPSVPAGDVLLGAGLVNSRSGNHIGALSPALADNATYAAFRVIRQNVADFEKLLSDVAAGHGLERELVAAKLMGRWIDGSPLTQHPDQPGGKDKATNDFDFVPDASGQGFDDAAGARCPVTSHLRRLNPRGSFVVGVPTGRRLVRRGMPYGPKVEPGKPISDDDRGLAGLFICADLESQFEFVQRVWANGDLFAPGLRDTYDPFVGSHPGKATPFHFQPRAGAPEITIDVPELTRTVGSLYLFMPGMQGLEHLAGGSKGYGRASSRLVFYPGSEGFRRDPYAFYREQRARNPVYHYSFKGAKKGKDGGVQRIDEFWILNRALVEEANDKSDVFLKPNRETSDSKPLLDTNDEGLFFMNPPRHGEVRPLLDTSLAEATKGIEAVATATARKLIANIQNAHRFKSNGSFDLVAEYASPLTVSVFANWMGLPADDERVLPLLSGWVSQMLNGHMPSAPLMAQVAAGTSSLALNVYLRQLMSAGKIKPTAAGTCPMAGALRDLTAPPQADGKAAPGKLTPDEAMLTAGHFALGGYESTEFLIASGTLHLLNHPEQLKALRDDASLMRGAVSEMLRYDAPFQMADRVAARAYTLGGTDIKAGDKVVLVYGSANRDPAFVNEPERFDISRKAQRHAAFGLGIHNCIGASLAMKVSAIAFTELLASFDRLSLAAPCDWLPDPYFRSPVSLLVTTRRGS